MHGAADRVRPRRPMADTRARRSAEDGPSGPPAGHTFLDYVEKVLTAGIRVAGSAYGGGVELSDWANEHAQVLLSPLGRRWRCPGSSYPCKEARSEARPGRRPCARCGVSCCAVSNHPSMVSSETARDVTGLGAFHLSILPSPQRSAANAMVRPGEIVLIGTFG